MDQQTYRKLISGQGSPLVGIPVRLLLTVLSWPYALVVRLRNALYSRHWLAIQRVDVPVLCIGNLTTGGTGKTPLVAWLARLLRGKGLRVAILTRGYKAGRGVLSDEPAELAAACDGAAVIVNPDRVAGATEAIDNHDAQVLLMDDGFQHRRLARNLDIITIDATQPFGYGRMLPAGLLREPLSGLRRAQAVVITRSDQVGDERLSQIESRVRRFNPELVVARAVHAPIGVCYSDGSESDLATLKGCKVFAFCGLGNPDAFFRTVAACAGTLVGSLAFNDHHAYTKQCLETVYDQARSRQAELLVTSSKDWSKITPLIASPPALPLAYLPVEVRFTTAGEKLTSLIERELSGTIVGL